MARLLIFSGLIVTRSTLDRPLTVFEALAQGVPGTRQVGADPPSVDGAVHNVWITLWVASKHPNLWTTYTL